MDWSSGVRVGRAADRKSQIAASAAAAPPLARSRVSGRKGAIDCQPVVRGASFQPRDAVDRYPPPGFTGLEDKRQRVKAKGGSRGAVSSAVHVRYVQIALYAYRVRALAVAIVLAAAEGQALAGQLNLVEPAPPADERGACADSAATGAGAFRVGLAVQGQRRRLRQLSSTTLHLGDPGRRCRCCPSRASGRRLRQLAHRRIDDGRARVRGRQVARFGLRASRHGGGSLSRRTVHHPARGRRVEDQQGVPSRVRPDARADPLAGRRAGHQVHRAARSAHRRVLRVSVRTRRQRIRRRVRAGTSLRLPRRVAEDGGGELRGDVAAG